ncbi:MAG TPA: CBS domain-containing protein [Steroidobacteraceae bacterium]
MNVGEHCKRGVVSIAADNDVVEAAKVMRQHHVGFLVVHEPGDELRKPIGVVTDRDLVLAVMAREVDPHAVTVRDVMTLQPLMASESDDLGDVLAAMRLAGVRRVPVVDARGALTGILAIDDAIQLITSLMCDLSGSIKSEQRQERQTRVGL